MSPKRLLPILLALSACGPGEPSETTPTQAVTAPEAPFVEILQPVPTGSYKVGVPVPVKAQVTDPDSDLTALVVSWQSSLDGALAQGFPDGSGVYLGEVTFSSPGSHQILVEATDPTSLSASASITLTVADREPPKVTLDPPPTGLKEGATATISGIVSDEEDDAEDLVVVWRVDNVIANGSQPNASGKVTLITDPLDAGVRQISLQVTDTDGMSRTARVDVTVAECPDGDRDGFPSCGGAGDDIDCDDRDDEINPDADELCDDKDQDCDGDIDEGLPDTDRDDVPDCRDTCPADPDNDRDRDGVCGDVDNCPVRANADQEDKDYDDIGDACDEEISELCDGEDNDSDGTIDEGFQSDADEDGVIDCRDDCPLDGDNDLDGDDVCGDVDNCPEDANSNQADADQNGVGDVCDFEKCDGKDNDRDGDIDEDFDQDDDGFPTCAVGANQPDCDDLDPDAYPGPVEVCGDGKDNDCDGLFDAIADNWEPNNALAQPTSLGDLDDSTSEIFPTIFSEDGIDSDYFSVIVDDDFAIGADKFKFTVELSQVPPGLNLRLSIIYGDEVIQSVNPGASVQTVTRNGVSGPDDDLYPYIIEVKNLGGSTLEACQPYRLWISNEG